MNMRKIAGSLLFAIGCVSGIVFLCTYHTVPIYVQLLFKLLPDLLMLFWIVSYRVNQKNLPLFVGIGCSLLCDFFMIFTGDIFIAFGILSNLLGIVCYIYFFLRYNRQLKIADAFPVFLVMALLYFVLFDNLGELVIPVLIYCLIYIVFVWRATVINQDQSVDAVSRNFYFYGSLLLTASDGLLSFLLFNVIPYKEKYYDVVMLLWWAGLFLLMQLAVHTSGGKAYSKK